MRKLSSFELFSPISSLTSFSFQLVSLPIIFLSYKVSFFGFSSKVNFYFDSMIRCSLILKNPNPKLNHHHQKTNIEIPTKEPTESVVSLVVLVVFVVVVVGRFWLQKARMERFIWWRKANKSFKFSQIPTKARGKYESKSVYNLEEKFS